MYDVPGVPVISNCGTPTEKMSELSPETQNAFSETLHKRHQRFLEKNLKNLVVHLKMWYYLQLM